MEQTVIMTQSTCVSKLMQERTKYLTYTAGVILRHADSSAVQS